MKLLLDTHILLWWLDNNPALSETAIDAISSSDNIVFTSTASIWEIVIKEALNKLVLPDNFKEVLQKEPFQNLDITTEHAYAVSQLPPHHQDPFDRILIAQSIVENLTFVTDDASVSMSS